MPSQINLKKWFLNILIGSLCLSALISIIIVMKGSSGDVENKILATSFIFAGFSLTSFLTQIKVRGTQTDETTKMVFSWTGLFTASVSFVITLLLVWNEQLSQDLGDNFFKLYFSLMVLAIGCTHINLMLLFKDPNPKVRISQMSTIYVILFLTLYIISLIWSELENTSDFPFRLILVLAILDTLGTLVTPIISIATKPKTTE